MTSDTTHDVAVYQSGERGQTMTEYALILAAVAIVAIVGYLALGTAVTTLINNVVKCL